MSLVLQFATRPRRIYMAACTLLAQSVIGPCRVHRRPALPQVSFLGWQSLLSLGRNYPSRTGLARAFVRPTNEMSSDDLSAACARKLASFAIAESRARSRTGPFYYEDDNSIPAQTHQCVPLPTGWPVLACLRSCCLCGPRDM